MRYAVTGATGFLGGALARRLLDDGHDVVATVRSPRAAAQLQDRGARIIQADLSDRAALTAAFAGCDGLFHVAGWYRVGSRNPSEGWRVNVAGTRNALGAAEAAGVARVVATSTVAVNSDTGGETVDERYHFTGEHLSVYDETKAQAHQETLRFAATHSVPETVIVMPGGIYGPGDTSQVGALMSRIAAGHRVMASPRLRFMQAHVDDVADGHVRAMSGGRTGQSYMLTGERTDLLAMLTEVADLTGGPRPLSVPAAVLRGSARTLGRLGRLAPLAGDYSAEAMRVATASYLGTSAKAQDELGWSFRGLHEGLQQTVSAEGWK